jgi:hypothetical protein
MALVAMLDQDGANLRLEESNPLSVFLFVLICGRFVRRSRLATKRDGNEDQKTDLAKAAEMTSHRHGRTQINKHGLSIVPR